MTEKEASELMLMNSDYIVEVKGDGQIEEMPRAPPPPEPYNEAQGSKACPGAPPWTTTTPNVQSKRLRQEADEHRRRVYMETLLTTAMHTCTMMGSTCRDMGETCRVMSIAQLKEADKYDKTRTELQKKLADTIQDAVTDEDV